MSEEMVSVPRSLLKTALAADASQGASASQLVNGWNAMAELRELISAQSLEEDRANLITYLRGEIKRFESIFDPTDLMLLRGGEKMLELCAPDGKFVGVSWDDMRAVLKTMVAVSPIGSGNIETRKELLIGFADEVKQLCKDFSDLQDRPYMGDVTSSIDSLLHRLLESAQQK